MSKIETLRDGLSVERDVYRPEALKIASLLGAVPQQSWFKAFSDSTFDRITFAPPKDSVSEEVHELLRAIDFEKKAGVSGQRLELINRYQPNTQGVWHPDEFIPKPVFVLGLTDVVEPSFQYARENVYRKTGAGTIYEGEESNHAGLVVRAGDLVRIDNGLLYHRGVNPSDEVRYSAVIWVR